jgi:hypothetical protein
VYFFISPQREEIAIKDFDNTGPPLSTLNIECGAGNVQDDVKQSNNGKESASCRVRVRNKSQASHPPQFPRTGRKEPVVQDLLERLRVDD